MPVAILKDYKYESLKHITITMFLSMHFEKSTITSEIMQNPNLFSYHGGV